MCRQISGSVCMYSEQVFLFSSFDRVTRRTRSWALACHCDSSTTSSSGDNQFAALLYFSCGYLKFSDTTWESFTKDPVDFRGSVEGLFGGADLWTWLCGCSALFCTESIHWDTSSLIPQPLKCPVKEKKKIYDLKHKECGKFKHVGHSHRTAQLKTDFSLIQSGLIYTISSLLFRSHLALNAINYGMYLISDSTWMKPELISL